MADSSQLAAILAGTDPLSPQILDALHAEQARDYVANPANWQNQGIAGAVGRTLAAFLVPNNTGTVADIAAQRAAARPEELAAYNNPAGPLAYAAAHQMSPVGLAQVLALPPEQVQNYIEAARLGRANSPGAAPLVNSGAPVSLPGYGKLNGPTSGGAPTPSASAPAGFPPDYTGRSPLINGASDVDVGQIAKMPADQQAQAVARLTPAQRLKLKQQIMLLRGRQATNAAPATTYPPSAM